MEQITIGITGTGAERHAAALMKSIYKTMAKAGNRCQIDIQSKHIKDSRDEIQIPEFMESDRKIAQFGGR